MKRFKFAGAVLVATLVAVTAAAIAYGNVPGVNGQLSHIACISEGGSGCSTSAHALTSPTNLAISKDESRIFVAASGDDAVAILNRDRTTGRLTQDSVAGRSCISETGTGGSCGTGNGLVGAADVVGLSTYVYWAATGSASVGFAKQDADTKDWKESTSGSGRCISETGADGCSSGYGLTGAQSIELTSDSASVYVGGTKSIAVFSRNKVNGALTEQGCVNDDGSDGCTDGYVPDNVVDILATSDGKFVYAATSGASEGAVLVFSRNISTGALTEQGCVSDDGSSGACTDGNNVDKPTGLSTDQNHNGGNFLYVAASGDNAVDVFSRNTANGQLTQLGGTNGCVSEAGGGCATGTALTGVERVNVYKTNKFVEVSAGNGVASFARDKHTGILTQLSGPGAPCINETGTGGCATGAGLDGAYGLLSTGGGKNLYVVGTTDNAVEALHIR